MSTRGRVRITPKPKSEPDLDQVVLALLAMLDEQRVEDAVPFIVDSDAPAAVERKAS